MIDNIALGMVVAFDPYNLLYCLLGALIGTLVGVLPGLGPVATIAILLPITFYLEPAGALIMLAGIYYGAQYGGSTTAILVNLPGESSSLVTCLDGYQLAKKGRAGAALAIAALASFFAGTVATFVVAFVGPPLSSVAMNFGPAEYCLLMILGLIGALVLANGSLLNATAMVVLGLLLGLVGTDPNSGQQRFTLALPVLGDGLGFAPVVMGLLGVAEIIRNLEIQTSPRAVTAIIGRLMPSRDEFMRSIAPTIRGSIIGCVLGVLPGGGALLASFAAYAAERRLSSNPARFGTGVIEGVAAPEAANNAGAQTSFIPMLTLGIPSNPTMAVMIGAMMIQGITPGPQIVTNQPGLFWGLIISMWIGNAMLLVINLPLIGIWVRLLNVPYKYLFPGILLICAIGVFSVNSSPEEVGIAGIFAALGYIFVKWGCEVTPLALGFVLGPLMEENLRRAMLMSRGDPAIFVSSVTAISLIGCCLLLVAAMLVPAFRRGREVAFRDTD